MIKWRKHLSQQLRLSLYSRRSFLGVLKVPLASELTIKRNSHVIQHLLAKMYMVIFIFHSYFESLERLFLRIIGNSLLNNGVEK